MLSKTIAAVICTVLVAAGAVVFLLPSGKPQSSREAVQDGVAYIKELETKDITEVDQELKLRVSMEALEGMDVWEKLDYFDTYIMGDSRTAIFNWSGINPDHIWAEASTTIKWIEEKKDLIENAKPKNLVLSFGMNDIGMYDTDPEHYWETAEDYVEAYRYYVDLIREVSPETHIYINSIVPALPAGIERQPRWAIAPEWNAALNEFCSAYGIGFIDVDYLADRYAEYYEADGVHLYYMDALNDWGESILEAVENKEFGL
ncbi:MAG: SGNH/GDSL hydrolase family protein [Parasporobacterium sp.]|nr:SGNH/GDSL hydrolase family protein [Parasporobacterium sp.]